VRYAELNELLQGSDIVTLHVPLVPDTRMMIGRSELEMMKSTAYLVNMARGELVDEKALYDYLQADQIAGAAVDVYAVEPPMDCPLTSLDKVLSTPHIAAYTFESMEYMDRMCAQTIIDAFRSAVTPNIINPQVVAQRGRSH
jgi:D-3-phosphoglycerate dehydrogenase